MNIIILCKFFSKLFLVNFCFSLFFWEFDLRWRSLDICNVIEIVREERFGKKGVVIELKIREGEEEEK